MATVDPVILQIKADVDGYVRDVRTSTAVVEQQLGRQEVAVNRHAQTFVRANAQSSQSMRLLGYQISDVGSQLAAGQSPFLILAQQAPQVANALEGTAGVAGRLATFFSGPWGAALLAAASVVGVLTGKLLEAKGAGEEAAQGYDTAANAASRYKSILDGIRGGQIDLQGAAQAALELEGLVPKRDRVLAQIKGLRGRESEAFPALKKELDAINAQIAQAETVVRVAEVAQRNQERLAKLGANAPAAATGGSARVASVKTVAATVAKEQRALEASLRQIVGQFDPAVEAAAKFRDTIKEIDKLEGAGLVSAASASLYRWQAAKEQAEAVAKSAAASLGVAPDGFDTNKIIEQATNRRDAEYEVNRQIAEDEAKRREENVRNLASLYEELLLGGTRNIWDTFKRLGIRVIAETLANFGASNGSGNFLASLAKGIGAAFGAPTTGRASGGYVAPRQTVRVNEGRGSGVELLRMGPQGGTVIPLGQINQTAARPGAGGGTATVRLELSGDLDARIQQISGGVAVEVVRASAPTLIDASARETTARLTRPRI
jgi:hypothetical protein